MRTLYYDCFSGISGDMNLAAMLNLGVKESHLRTELAKLNISDEFELKITPSSKNGIHGTRVDVILKEHHHHHHHSHPHTHTHEHSHEHPHTHHPKSSPSIKHQASNTKHHSQNRNLNDITTIIEQSTLSTPIKKSSLAIFKRIAIAESHVHNCPIDEIHFHEVGATDAIVDIVGAAICREALNIDQVLCSSIELGGGFVNCAHGRIPVPAPATIEILRNIPTRRGAVQHETTTPTGAAILAETVNNYTDTPALTIEKTAYGIGHRDMEIPNALRVQLGTTSTIPAIRQQPLTIDAILLECTVDDMTAEALGYAMERLISAGANDVNFIPTTMKKSRPATIVSVLCSPENEEALKEIIFHETTTLGIKSITVSKTMLERRTTQCQTKYGPITIKEALLNGTLIRSKPEFEECATIARKENIPLSDVYQEIRNQ